MGFIAPGLTGVMEAAGKEYQQNNLMEIQMEHQNRTALAQHMLSIMNAPDKYLPETIQEAARRYGVLTSTPFTKKIPRDVYDMQSLLTVQRPQQVPTGEEQAGPPAPQAQTPPAAMGGVPGMPPMQLPSMNIQQTPPAQMPQEVETRMMPRPGYYSPEELDQREASAAAMKSKAMMDATFQQQMAMKMAALYGKPRGAAKQNIPGSALAHHPDFASGVDSTQTPIDPAKLYTMQEYYGRPAEAFPNDRPDTFQTLNGINAETGLPEYYAVSRQHMTTQAPVPLPLPGGATPFFPALVSPAGSTRTSETEPTPGGGTATTTVLKRGERTYTPGGTKSPGGFTAKRGTVTVTAGTSHKVGEQPPNASKVQGQEKPRAVPIPTRPGAPAPVTPAAAVASATDMVDGAGKPITRPELRRSVSWAADQATRNEAYLPQLAAQDKWKYGAVTAELARRGVDVHRLTATSMAMAEMAHAILPKINDAIMSLEKPGVGERLGPIMSRYREFLAGKIGADDPEFIAIRTSMSLILTATMRAHFGARGGQQMYDHFIDLLNSGRMTPANLISSMKEMRKVLGSYESLEYGKARATWAAEGLTPDPAKVAELSEDPGRLSPRIVYEDPATGRKREFDTQDQLKAYLATPTSSKPAMTLEQYYARLNAARKQR